MNSRRIGRRVHWWLLMVVTMIAVRSRTAQAVCPADVVPSGTVDVNDLLAVITTWGPCP